MGMTIKDAPLVEQLSGEEKIPISDGSNEPRTVNVGQIKEFSNKDIEIPKKVSELENDSGYATQKEVEEAISKIPTPDVSGQIEEHNQDESAHPFIQNKIAKVVSEVLSDYVKKETGKGLSSNDFTNELKSRLESLENYDDSEILESLSSKVDKVEGKGLSTNDFTNELKAKLESLTPYDPSELEAEIGKLETTLNTLVSGNASNAIESFNEIVAFLNSVSDTETLSGIIAGINTRIAEVEGKIPTKVSQLDNDKGYLTEHQDISHLATKNELTSKQDKIEDLEEIRQGASRTIPTKTSELTNDSGFLTEHQDVSNLATKQELEGKQDVISDLANIREGAAKGATALQSVPEEYVTEAELEGKGYLTEHQDISHLATKTEVNEVNAKATQALNKATEAGENFNALEAIVNTKAGAFYVENETGLFVIFTDEAAKMAYIYNGDESGVIGKFALGGAESETVYMMTVNTPKDLYSFTTSSEKMEITAGFTSQVKYTDEEGYIEFKEAALFSVSVIKSGAESVVVSSGNVVKQGETFTFDVKPYVGNGDNTVVITAEGLVSASKGVAAVTVGVTSMALLPMDFKWNVPFVEDQSYALGGLKVLGTLDKKLHIKMSGTEYSESYEVNIGTAQYDEIAYTFDGLVHPSATGVYKVEMWLEATESGLTSETLTYRIMCIKADEVSTAQLIVLNDVATEVLNYSESKLFSYSVYNGGASTATPSITIHKDSDIIAESSLSVSTSTIHDYVYSFMLNIAESTAQIGVFATFGNEAAAIITLKNEASLAPVSGYSFYMDAATRANGDDSREFFINEATQEKVNASWVDMAWVNGMDGWTTDNEGNKCLLIPAMSSASVDLTPMKNVSTVSIEMLYKVSNVSDFNEDIITILSDTTSSWIGMRIKPTNITLHSQSLFTEDLKQGYNTKDEEMVHLVVTIISNYSGIGNVAMIYVNGVKKCSFEWAKGDTFAHDGTLKLGSQTADLYLYKMRVYGFAFSWQQVMQNYIASITSSEEKAKTRRKEDSVLNDANEIDYDKVYGVYNTFVVELPKGAQLPNRKNNPSNDAINGTNLYINIVQDTLCSIQGEWLDVPLEGQGTTAMTYYRWNQRTKTSSVYGKFRITAKKNVASSMHSHKRGATALYNDLNLAIVGANEADGRVAVYQYPAYGFQKIENEDKPGTYYYQFIGLYTIGPDKGDKSTFGYDNEDYENTLIHMEGTDHSPRGVGMEYPWEQMVVGLNEDGDAFIGAADANGGMAEGAWEIGACGDKEEVADMKAYLDVEFAPAYKLDYECTPMIVGLPSGTSIDDVNADVKNFRSQVADNGFTYADCHIYIDGEYELYYFNINSQTYVKDGRKIYQGLADYGFSESELASKATTLDKTKYIRQYRMARYRAEAGNYWLLDDSLFHACFLDLIGATDNEKKNSYPYKFGTLASGSRWRWRQDDLDTIFDVNNQGSADKKYSIMNTDTLNGDMIYKGNTSYHWRCIREYFPDEYKAMMKTIMAKMVELCPNGYGSSQIQKLVGCMRHYFWDYAQDYFTGGAYNQDAKWTYEDAWALYQSDKNVNAVHPLQQSLGSHYEAEVSWVTLRMLFLASMNEFGAFVDYVDSSEGQVSFRQGGDFTFSLTPAIDMRPSVIQGKNSKKIHADGRVMAGDSVDISMPTDTSADTMVYIQGADWLSDIGDFSKVQIGSTDKTFSVSSKRAQRIKVGDETASEVTTNIGKLDVGYCPSVVEVEARNVSALTDNVDLSKCPRLRRAYFGGTNVTAITLPDGSKIQAYDLPSSLIRLSLRQLPLLTGNTYKQYEAELEYTGKYYVTNQGVGNKCTYAVTSDTNVAGGLVINLNNVKSITVTGKGGNSPRLWCFVNSNDIILSCAESQASATDLSLTIPANATKCIVQFMASASYKVVIEKGEQGGLTYSELNNLTYLWIEDNAKIEGYDLLKTALEGGSPLNNIRVIGFDKQGDATDMTTLKTLANGEYHGIDAEGNNDNESYPIIEGSLHVVGSASGEDRDFIVSKFPYLNLTADKFLNYIKFADPEVLRVLLANGVDKDDDGGITEEEAAAVTSIGTWFNQNTIIETFDEFEKFTGVTALGGNNMHTSPFYKCTSLKRIKLPNSITQLKTSLFSDCTSLESIPDLTNITYIGPRVFSNCIAMNGIVNIPNLASDFGGGEFYSTSISKVQSLGQMKQLSTGSNNTTSGSFGQCLNLESVILPDSLTRIGPFCFYGCTKLSNINIPESLKIINDRAFAECTSLEIEDLSLPNLETLGQNAFYGVSIKKISNLGKITALPTSNSSNQNFGKKDVLEEVVLPETLTQIPGYSFQGYTYLKCEIQSATISLETNAFRDCVNITDFPFDKITHLDTGVFVGTSISGRISMPLLTELIDSKSDNGGPFINTKITAIDSLGSVKSIIGYINNSRGFVSGCTLLEYIILPPTVESIGSFFVYNCPKLESIVIHASTPPSIQSNTFSGSSYNFYVPDASVEAYKSATNWSTYASRIKPLSDWSPLKLEPQGGYFGSDTIEIKAIYNLEEITPIWTVESDVATISTNGILTFTGIGSASVTATYNGWSRTEVYNYVEAYTVNKMFTPSTTSDVSQIINTGYKLFSDDMPQWTLRVSLSDIDFSKMANNGSAVTCGDESGSPYAGIHLAKNAGNSLIKLDINPNGSNIINTAEPPTIIIRRNGDILESSINGGTTYVTRMASIASVVSTSPRLATIPMIVGGYYSSTGTLGRPFYGKVKLELYDGVKDFDD